DTSARCVRRPQLPPARCPMKWSVCWRHRQRDRVFGRGRPRELLRTLSRTVTPGRAGAGPAAATSAHRSTSHVAVAIAALERAALLMSHPESILAAARLAYGEVGNRTRRGSLALRARKRRSNQRTMNRTFLGRIVTPGFLVLASGRRCFVCRGEG